MIPLRCWSAAALAALATVLVAHQYKSVENSHRSTEHRFSHSGTNGFTSTVDVEGDAGTGTTKPHQHESSADRTRAGGHAG